MDILIMYICMGMILMVFKYGKLLANLLQKVNDKPNITEQDIKNLESYVKSR